MKCLVIISLIGLAVIASAKDSSGKTADWRSKKIKVCRIHKVTLTAIKVPVLWGLRRSGDDSRMHRSANFPYSSSVALGGCCIPKNPAKHAYIHRCSECYRLAIEWKEKHDPTPKHRRPVAPNGHKALIREAK